MYKNLLKCSTAHRIRPHDGFGHVEHQSSPRHDQEGHVDKPDVRTRQNQICPVRRDLASPNIGRADAD